MVEKLAKAACSLHAWLVANYPAQSPPGDALLVHWCARAQGCNPTQIAPGAVVMLGTEMAQVQSLQGFMVAAERLGPGVVQEVAADGLVRVRWSKAMLESWTPAAELDPVEAGRRIVAVLRCDGNGHKTLLRQLIARVEHHWTIELRPDAVVRAERYDGLAWTFRHDSATHRIMASWLEPPEDADAEAYFAAELALA